MSGGRAPPRSPAGLLTSHPLSVASGTPTEGNWPGISSIEEFKSYNFPKYKPQPIINHAPRYVRAFVRVCSQEILWNIYTGSDPFPSSSERLHVPTCAA